MRRLSIWKILVDGRASEKSSTCLRRGRAGGYILVYFGLGLGGCDYGSVLRFFITGFIVGDFMTGCSSPTWGRAGEPFILVGVLRGRTGYGKVRLGPARTGMSFPGRSTTNRVGMRSRLVLLFAFVQPDGATGPDVGIPAPGAMGLEQSNVGWFAAYFRLHKMSIPQRGRYVPSLQHGQ